MKKLFTLAAAVMASLSLSWAVTYVRVDSIDFTNTTNFPAVTYTNQSATVHGVFFKAKSGKNVKVNNTTSGVDFDGTNLGSGDHGIAIPVTGVNGSLKVIVYHDYNNTSANHRVGVSHATGNDPSAAQTWDLTPTNSGGTKNKNEFILTKSSLTGTDYIVWVGESSSSYKVIKRVAIYTEAPECDEPAKPLVLSSDAAATVYVGDVITFTTGETGNGGTVTIEGANSETITDSKWTATEGEHTFTASQEKNGDFCAQESELKLSVKAKTPVTACSIEGPTAGYKGNKVTYTATAANAAEYRWTVDGAIQDGAESATFEFTPSANRTYKIVGQARNDFNATSEWISSDPISLTVTSLYGTLVSYVVDGGTAAKDKTGALSAVSTPKVSLTSGSSSKLTVDEVEYTGYKMDKGKYVGVTLSSGSFAEGDSVFFLITTKTSSAKLYLYNDEAGTLRLDSIESDGRTGWVYFVLNQATTGVYMYRSNPDVKPYDQNPYIAAVKVVRPMPVKSVAESLTAVKVDGVAISSEDLTTLLSSAHKVDLAAAYAAAPEVKFNKHIVKTYEDDSQKESDELINVTAEKNGLGRWEAKATINAIEYTVTAGVNASATITYMYGEEKLGEEVVALNGNPAKYAEYQAKDLATFGGWYSDKALSSAVADIASAVIDQDTTFYATYTYKHAASVNIEQWILDNGAGKGTADKTNALLSTLGSNNYAVGINWANGGTELDSLANKADRNEPYLGLKIKKGGSMLNFRLADGSELKIKFGAIKSTKPQISINGGEYAEMVITDNVYSYEATGETLLSFKTVDDNAVVLKQIMINEAIQIVVLPDDPTALDNTEAEVKAVKRVVNGQLMIEKNGVIYNAQGAIVR